MAQQGGTYTPRAAVPPRPYSSFRSSSQRSDRGDDNEKKVDGRSFTEEDHINADEKVDGDGYVNKARKDDTQTTPVRRDNADNQSDDEEWTIVPHPNAGMRGISNQFDLRIGWGNWRYSVLSWDVSVRVKRDQSS